MNPKSNGGSVTRGAWSGKHLSPEYSEGTSHAGVCRKDVQGKVHSRCKGAVIGVFGELKVARWRDMPGTVGSREQVIGYKIRSRMSQKITQGW